MPDAEKPTKSRKGGHKGTREEVRLRREKVAYLRAQGFMADEIWEQLHGNFPHATLKVVYDDIEHIQRHAREYIALEYLPNFGDRFNQAVLVLEYVKREALRRYRDGETETREGENDKGGFSMTIHREGSSDFLRLAAMAALADLKLANSGPVALAVNQIIQENKRLGGRIADVKEAPALEQS